MNNTLVVVLTFNEGEKFNAVLEQFPVQRDYSLLIIDDGSTDNTDDIINKHKLPFIRHNQNLGVGAGIRTAANYASENNFENIVIMAGNGKMLPGEIDRLIQPILTDQADYVQGSRYMEGGQSPHLPSIRNIAIKIFTAITNFILGFKGTDITCGFRAYRLSILNHAQIDINQAWLGKYEMEYYLHYKVIKAGFRVVEVPVSMVYPSDGKNYSKIKPFIGWWSMLRPWIYLSLRLKK